MTIESSYCDVCKKTLKSIDRHLNSKTHKNNLLKKSSGSSDDSTTT